MISVDEATTLVLNGASRLTTERITLGEAAGRVLAEDLANASPMPAFDNSAMDGYALNTASFSGAGPWVLSVKGESRAGAGASSVQAGSACRIFTGAPVPAGANAVVMQENVTREADTIALSEAPRAGQHIRCKGVDLPAGTTILRAGQRLHPGRLGMVASLDRAHLLVARRPVVSILSTGDELRPPGTSGPAASIPESNSYVIAAIARRLGAVVRVMPLLADDPTQTVQQTEAALAGCDLLVTIGGASVGDHDLVRPALEALGVKIDFWGVAVKPGKPVAHGRHKGHRIICLPGNPASATLTFLLFGVPLLRAFLGEPTLPQPFLMPVRGSLKRRTGRQEYLRARLEVENGERWAVLPDSQSSGAVRSFADAEALILLEPSLSEVRSGDRLPVMLLSEIWS